MTAAGGRWRLAGALLALWVGSTVLQASLLAVQEPTRFGDALVHFALEQALFPAFVVLVWRLSGWLEGRPWVVSVPVHLAVGIACIALWEVVSYVAIDLRSGHAAEIYRYKGVWMLFNTALQYALLAAGVVAVRASRRLEVQRRRAAELALLAREAEARALKAQLRPHFLFNVLNSVYSLVEARPAEAQEMIALLSDLMRRTLEAGEDALVPLSWELAATEAYLGIERIRLRERLVASVDRDGADPDIPVPPLVLQPLVENAVKHGAAKAVAGGRVSVEARRREGWLELLVRNDVAATDTPNGHGRGLELTRARLAAVYGSRFSMETSAAAGVFEVRLRLPAAVEA